MQSRPMPTPRERNKPSEEQRVARLKLSHAVVILKNMTGVTRTRKTIYNWCVNGKRAYSGEKIILGHEVVAGEFFTTKQQLRDFLAELRR